MGHDDVGVSHWEVRADGISTSISDVQMIFHSNLSMFWSGVTQLVEIWKIRAVMLHLINTIFEELANDTVVVSAVTAVCRYWPDTTW